MRFPKKFVRYLGADLSPLLGDDDDPTTLTAAEQSAYRKNDNVLTCRLNNTNGFPVQRVAVGCNFVAATTGTPTAITLSVFVWDDTTERWFKVQHATAPTVNPNSVTFVDVVSLLDFPNTEVGTGLQSTGALEIAIVPAKPDTYPDGTYTFVAGADVSNPGV